MGRYGGALWLAMLAGLAYLLLARRAVVRAASCQPCGAGRHHDCHPTTPPDLPGERGCCCGQLVPR